jgi:hypothetical protein
MQHYHKKEERKLSKKNNVESNESLLNSNIEKRLDTIISLLLNPKNSEYTDIKKIEYLTKMSFSNDEIAKLLGTTKNSVEAQKYKKSKTSTDLKKSKK